MINLDRINLYYVTPIHFIAFGAIYYILIHEFLERVAIGRLTKSSFRVGITDFLDLSIAYNLSILACMYFIFYHSYSVLGITYFKVLDWPKIALDGGNSAALLATISAFLFIGRILTKKKGVFFGRVHFSSIFLAISIYISTEILLAMGETHSIDLLYVNLYNRINNFINFYNLFGNLPVVCSLTLVICCETLLSMTTPSSKNLLVISDKFPSDFRVITGLNGFAARFSNNITKSNYNYLYKISKKRQSEMKDVQLCNELIEEKRPSIDPELNIFKLSYNFCRKLINSDSIENEMYSMLYPRRHSIKKISCVTRSLVMIDIVTNTIPEIFVLRKIDVRVIIAPSSTVFRDLEFAMKSAPWSLGDIIRYKNYKIQKYKREYCERLRKLRKLKLDRTLKIVEYYLGRTVFLIVEYDNGEKGLIFSIRDSGSMLKRVGLYTQEPHVISHFENIFDKIWGDQYDKDNF